MFSAFVPRATPQRLAAPVERDVARRAADAEATHDTPTKDVDGDDLPRPGSVTNASAPPDARPRTAGLDRAEHAPDL